MGVKTPGSQYEPFTAFADGAVQGHDHCSDIHGFLNLSVMSKSSPM